MQRCVVKLFREQKQLGRVSMLVPKVEVYDKRPKDQPLAISNLDFDCTAAAGKQHDILLSTIIMDIIPTEIAIGSCSVVVPKAEDFAESRQISCRVTWVGVFQGTCKI